MFIHEFQHETAMQLGRDKFSGLHKHKSNWPRAEVRAKAKAKVRAKAKSGQKLQHAVMAN